MGPQLKKLSSGYYTGRVLYTKEVEVKQIAKKLWYVQYYKDGEPAGYSNTSEYSEARRKARLFLLA